MASLLFFFFFSSRRRHTRLQGDWSSDVCSSDLDGYARGKRGITEMTLEDGYHDVGGVLDGEIPGPGPDRGHREAREFPLARLFQRRAPRARHPVAGHWLGVASDDRGDHALRRPGA